MTSSTPSFADAAYIRPPSGARSASPLLQPTLGRPAPPLPRDVVDSASTCDRACCAGTSTPRRCGTGPVLRSRPQARIGVSVVVGFCMPLRALFGIFGWSDPSNRPMLICVESDRWFVSSCCTPSGLNRGTDCSACPLLAYAPGAPRGSRPRLGSGRHAGDSPPGIVPPAPPARPTAARRPNAGCIG